VTDHPIDQALRRASEEIPPVEPELLQKIAHSMQSSLRPVRPLPPTWMLAAGLTLISAAVAGAAAAAIGFYGIEKMLPWQRVLIFSALGMMAWTWGAEFVRQLTPGSRRYLGAGTSFSIGTLMLIGVLALVFRDYHTDHFIAAGLACLRSGLLLAIPAALLSWLLLRRGFAVNTIAAGFAAGALAGVCGVAMLALHCANFQALHVIVWHTGVVPVSAAVGALAGWALRGPATAALR
jgi:Negative regulator of sigma F